MIEVLFKVFDLKVRRREERGGKWKIEEAWEESLLRKEEEKKWKSGEVLG